VLQKPGDKLSLVKGDNPLTGPFYVDGAEPGDTLAVKILDLEWTAIRAWARLQTFRRGEQHHVTQ